MSGLNVLVDRKTFSVAILLILLFVIAVLVLTTLKKNLKKFAITNYEHPRRKFKFAVFIEESILNIKLKRFFFLFVVLN